jgi:hypothetical protein
VRSSRRQCKGTHLADGLADRHLLELGPALLLDTLGQEHDLDVANLVKAGVRLLVRVDKVLDFSHRELAHAEETLPGGNFVAERAANLGRGEGHAAVVELEQAREVDEVALGRLGPEEAARTCRERPREVSVASRTGQRSLAQRAADLPLDVAGRADRRLEHQVELLGLRQVVLRLGVLDAEAADELAELGTGVVVDLTPARIEDGRSACRTDARPR